MYIANISTPSGGLKFVNTIFCLVVRVGVRVMGLFFFFLIA